MDWVPSGDLFLSEYSIKELKSMYKKEKKSKAKLRLLCATLRKRGESVSDISKSLEIPIMTVSDWLRRLHKKGLDGIHDKKQSGRPNRLSKDQLKELEGIIDESPQFQDLPYIIWTTKLVRDFIEERYGVSYKPRQVRNITKNLGFSSQKPRPKHRKASIKAQEDFKKTSGKKLDHILKMDMRASFWTRVSSQ